MTQQVFADRLGKSKSWVDKVERGVRALNKFSVIQEIGEVLRVDPLLLLGRDTSPLSVVGPHVDGLDRVCSALACHEVFRTEVPVGCVPAREFQRHVGHAWLTFQHGHYTQLVRMLPGLLDAAQRQHMLRPEQGSELLVQVYRITASLLVKLRQAQRALRRDRLALSTTTAAADRIRHGGQQMPPEELFVLGALLLPAAYAAAGCGDHRRVDVLLDRAAEVAAGIGDGTDRYQTSFGPVAVALTEVVTTVEFGDAGEALRRHEEVTGRHEWRLLPAEYWAAYLVDVVRAYLQLGDLAGAGRLLVEADRAAPAEVRCRPTARTLLAEVYRGGESAAGVAQLAVALGLGR